MYNKLNGSAGVRLFRLRARKVERVSGFKNTKRTRTRSVQKKVDVVLKEWSLNIFCGAATRKMTL